MSRRHVRFIWGAGDTIKGRWYLGLVGRYDREGRHTDGLAISVRGLLCWVAGAAVAGYLGLATALFAWFERRPENLIRYSDTLLLPLRWSHVRELRGRMMIEDGLNDLKERRWAEAHMKLRIGLGRDPRNRQARLALADFYQLANRRESALQILEEGLRHGWPGRPFLARLFSLASEGEDFEVVVAACEALDEAAGTDRPWLRAQRIHALIGAQRPEEALTVAEAEGDDAGPMAKEGRVLALLELRRISEALAALEAWRAASDAGTQPRVLRLQVRALREAGRIDDMNRAWAELRQFRPADPRTYLYGIVQKWLAGEQHEAAAALDEFFLRYAASAPTLLSAASGLAEAKATPLIGRCVERAGQQGFALRPFQLVLLHAQIAAADWSGATRTLDEIKPTLAGATPVEAFAARWLEQLLAVAARPDEAPAVALLELLRQRPLSMRIFRQTCEALVAAGRFPTAHAVLEIAARSYPSSRTLAGLRMQVDEALARAAIPVAPVLPQPAVPVPSEREFFASLARDAEAAQWNGAAQSIRQARIAKPEWLGRREAEVLDWQMRVAVQTGDTLELLGAAKLYLDGSRARALRVVALAREIGDTGREEIGGLLLNEVLRKNAGFPPALRLQKEWQPAATEPAAPAAAAQTESGVNVAGGSAGAGGTKQ